MGWIREILESILKQDFVIDKKENIQINIQCFSESECVPDPNEIDPNLKTLIIFDDIMLEKQNKIEDYYTRGRHNNIDCFYISQNYIKLPKNMKMGQLVDCASVCVTKQAER